MIVMTSSFTKSSVFKMSSIHTVSQSRSSSGLKSVQFVNLRFRDGLVCTVGLAVEIKLERALKVRKLPFGKRNAYSKKSFITS